MEGVAHSQSLALQWHRGRARRPRGRGSMQRARAPSSRSPVLNHPTNRLRPCSCAPSCALALSHGNAVCHLHDDLSPPGMKEDNQAPFFPKAVARLPLPLSLSPFVKQLLTFAMGKLFFLPPPTRSVPPCKAEFLLEDSGGDGAVALFAESPRAHTHARARHKAVSFLWFRGERRGGLFSIVPI